MIKNLFVKFNCINIVSILYYFFRLFKIKNNKIFCQNFTNGKGLGDSPKYIALELLKDKEKKYDIVWAVKDIEKNKNVPQGIRLVKIYSLKYFYEMATAKIWISNTRFELFTRKRKNQFYIQTWHSPLRLKKIEVDAWEYLSDYYKKCMKNDSRLIDIILSGCKFSTNIYKNSFLYDGEILELGTPRCDIFFDKEVIEEKKNEIQKRYKLKSKKNILYAPTFRKHSTDYGHLMDFDLISSKIGEEYNILVRSHPSEKIDFSNYSNIVDVSDYPDIQDLLCWADILITDYSSCSFDMMIANKPCFLLTKDLKEYLSKERDLYFDFKELPFVKCNTDLDLIKNITDFNINDYNDEINKFKEKIGIIENGTAAKRVKEIIDYKCYGDKNE